MTTYMCPVCGFPGLLEPARSASGGPSYEICPSCGFEFGVTDDDAGYSYEGWRKKWVQEGMSWRYWSDPPADDWDPKSQLGGLPLQPDEGPLKLSVSFASGQLIEGRLTCALKKVWHISFTPIAEDSPRERSWIALGTVDIYVDFTTGQLLWPFGYLRPSDWSEGMLPEPAPESGAVRGDRPELFAPWRGYWVSSAGEWPATYDPHNGWVRVAASSAPADDSQTEFASGTLVGIRDGALNSLWLRPSFIV